MTRDERDGSGRLPREARRLLHLGSVRKDLDEELSFHFEKTVEELVAGGYSRSAARDEAARRFGNERDYRRELESIDRVAERRRAWSGLVDTTRQMVVQAVRSIVRSPGLTIGVVLAFALGIGANATMFSIIDRLLLRAPGQIVDPDRVAHLYYDYLAFNNERFTDGVASYPDFEDMLRVKSLSGAAAESDRSITIGTGDEAHTVEADLVTGNFFQLLGTRPALGRFFDPEKDFIGGAREAVLSYSMWQREYGGERSALGQTIDFGYGPYTIVGVTPRGFTGATLARHDVYLPLRVAAAQIMGDGWAPEPEGRGWQWLQVFVRLAPGVTPERAAAEMTAVHRSARAKDILDGNWGKDPKIIPGSLIEARGPNASNASLVARVLAAVSLLVLLIACVNVANLLLARTIRQQRETAVRLALGISRTRLVAQVILEGVILALMGGCAALLVERWGGGVVRSMLLPDVAWDELGGNNRVLIAVAALAVMAGIVATLVPASQLLRRDLAETIRKATAGGLSRTTSRVRISLALAQTALSVILLVGAGLFLKSLHNARNVNMGFEPDGLVYARFRSPRGAFTDEERGKLYLRGLGPLSRIPGVKSVASSSAMPFTSRSTRRIRVQGFDSIAKPNTGGPFIHGVTPGYFETMGIEILRGRGIEATDTKNAPLVAVINEDFAKYVWKGESPLGKCLYIGQEDTKPGCTTIVGVSAHASNIELRDDVMVQYYVPAAQTAIAGDVTFWLVRVDPRNESAIAEVKRTIAALDTRIRLADVTPFSDLIESKTQAWTLGATMLSVFGVIALIVAAIGLYSVLAFDIAQRTRELGLRTALGATAGELIRMVVARAVIVTAFGLVIGGVCTLLLAPRVKDLLFDTTPRDPATFGIVGAVLFAVALVAATIPGWRATRVDPNVALRSE